MWNDFSFWLFFPTFHLFPFTQLSLQNDCIIDKSYSAVEGRKKYKQAAF